MNGLQIAECEVRSDGAIARGDRRSLEIRTPRRAVRAGQSHARRARRAIRNGLVGLTLIELLVVIAIVTIIVSAIVVASFSALKAGQVRGTRGVMEKIALALAQYKLDYGMYRPSSDSTGAAYNPVADSTYPLWEALEFDGKYLTVPAANKLADTTGPPEAPNPRYKYIDSWKQPLYYECLPDPGTDRAKDFQRFRLTSGGPDLIIGDRTDAADETWGDNIVIE